MSMHMTYMRTLVANPASGFKAGAVFRLRSCRPSVGNPETTIFTDADTGREMAIPTRGYEVFYRVFVYGSLMRGFGNHRLLETSRYRGRASTGAEFHLYSLGGFPAAVRAGYRRVRLRGEVYEVNAATLAQLDRLEGVNSGFYDREWVRLRKRTHPAFIYTMRAPPRGGKLLDSGDWRTATPARVAVLDDNDDSQEAFKW